MRQSAGNGKLVPATRVPATVGNYMSHLGPIFVVANTAWKMPLDRAQYLGGLGVAWQLGVAGKSTAREVRPTMEQLDILMGHFIRKAYDSVPMHKLLPFARASCRGRPKPSIFSGRT